MEHISWSDKTNSAQNIGMLEKTGDDR